MKLQKLGLNYSAGLLILGSVFLNPDMLKAAQRQLGLTEKQAKSVQAELCSSFEQNLRKELSKDRDLMLEALLFDGDTTLEGKRVYDEKLRKRFDRALIRTLKESSFYKELRISLTDGLRDRLAGTNTGGDTYSETPITLSSTDRRRVVPERKFIGVSRLKPSASVSLDGEGLDYTVRLGFEGLNIGGFVIDNGKVAYSPNRLELQIERILGEKMHATFGADIENFDDPQIQYQASVSGLLGKNTGLSVQAVVNEEGKGGVNLELTKYF